MKDRLIAKNMAGYNEIFTDSSKLMNQIPLTDEMRRFILINIPSVPYLEALLIMRADKNHLWCKEELANRLFIKVNYANDLLSQLKASGIIKNEHEGSDLYRYCPYSSEMQHEIDVLAEVYSNNLIDVTNLIHSKTEKKALNFANAFILKKDK